MNTDYRFKVNLGGMIEILSDHLYSSPDVYIRELLQNAVDAITGYKKYNTSDNSYEGRITLEIDEEKQLIFTDNGQGLTQEEIHQFLAIIGESSKRSLETGRIETDYIGRFGIGLMSCFMVSDNITMLTKSCKDTNAPILQWCGRPDGTYTIENVSSDDYLSSASGTKVILQAKADMKKYFTRKHIEELITYYGMLLPVPIVILQEGSSKQINPKYLPWEGRKTNKDELMLFGQLMFNEIFFDCIPFHSAEGNVSGVAYISNYSVLPSIRQKHRIYLKNMLLTENGDNLIPDWAVFTKCIVNATNLRPTASREGFYVDDMLDLARNSIENAIIDYIDDIAQNDEARFKSFFQIHNLSLMSLALATPRLFDTLIDYFEFETTQGLKTGYDLRMLDKPLVYAPTEARYKQLSQLYFAQNELLINVSYVHSLSLLHTMGEVFDIEINPVDNYEIEDLMNDLSLEDSNKGFQFLRAASRCLKVFDCKAELRYFSPPSQPTFYMINEEILLKRRIAATRAQADSMFLNMLDAFAADISDDSAAILYFNYNNPVVKKLVALANDSSNEPLLKTMIEIFYVQALQIGGFTLHNNELGLLNQNILSLMERGLDNV